jgi:hypothetical protein
MSSKDEKIYLESCEMSAFKQETKRERERWLRVLMNNTIKLGSKNFCFSFIPAHIKHYDMFL